MSYQVCVQVIDDYDPDPNRRPVILFGPFDDMAAAVQWGDAHEHRFNDWQVVTVAAFDGHARITIWSPTLPVQDFPLQPIPSMDPELWTPLEPAAQRQTEQGGARTE